MSPGGDGGPTRHMSRRRPPTPDLDQQARDILDRIRYVVLGTIDEDGRTRTSPVYFKPHGYEDLYWVSNPASHHSRNLERDNRLSGVVFDSTVPPGPRHGSGLRDRHRPRGPGGRARAAPAQAPSTPTRGARVHREELTGDADLRLWVLHVDSWEVHIRGGHPTLGTGRTGGCRSIRVAGRLRDLRRRFGYT